MSSGNEDSSIQGSYDGVVIYDGDCPYCSTISKVLERLDDIGVVPWQDGISQEFLRTQFGQAPFAMFFVDLDDDKIYAGSSAAKELADRAGMPEAASRLVSDKYDKIAEIVSFAAQRSKDPDDYHDTYKLRDEAREMLEQLEEYATDSSVANMDT